MHRWWFAAVALVLVFLGVERSTGAAEKNAPAKKPAAAKKDKDKARKSSATVEPGVFALEEVSAFGTEKIGGKTRQYFPSGPFVPCVNKPSKEVKQYPEFKSKRPLYGSVVFGGSFLQPRSGKTFYFALDQSDDAKKRAKSEEKKPAASSGTPQGEPTYDLLYFDCNGDLDLTNDGVVKLAKKTPFEDMPESMATGFFDELKVMFDFGPGLGQRPFALVPHVLSYDTNLVLVRFLPKTARKGKIRLGGEQYMARLSQSRFIYGRYDRPMVQLELTPLTDSKEAAMMPTPLGQMRYIDGHFVTLSATPLGDKLTVEPYRGETGVLEIGAGGRAVTEMGIAGQLMSSKGAMIAMGEANSRGTEAMPRRYDVPVGDYMLPAFMAQQGRLRFAGRMTSEVAPLGGKLAAGPSFPIQIRKDKPFVVEFSGKPDVKFASPAKDQPFKPGDTVRISAMLTEPWQGVQITGLWDSTRKQEPTGFTRLDPTIAIRDSSGKVVAEGKMPFG